MSPNPTYQQPYNSHFQGGRFGGMGSGIGGGGPGASDFNDGTKKLGSGGPGDPGVRAQFNGGQVI